MTAILALARVTLLPLANTALGLTRVTTPLVTCLAVLARALVTHLAAVLARAHVTAAIALALMTVGALPLARALVTVDPVTVAVARARVTLLPLVLARVTVKVAAALVVGALALALDFVNDLVHVPIPIRALLTTPLLVLPRERDRVRKIAPRRRSANGAVAETGATDSLTQALF